MRTQKIHSRQLVKVFFGSATLLLGGAALGGASPLVYVANNGIDASACGARAKPCRSITRAIANAPSGSVIVVGPGRYGDLNGDGKFDAPGEEQPQNREYLPPTGGPPVQLNCVVCILKTVQLVSTFGAEATVIDAGNGPYNVVQIVGKSVYFGDVGKGFSLIHAGTDGAGNGGDGLSVLAGPARVRGNIATANIGCGFDLVPGGESFYGQPSNTLGGNVTAGNNTALGNGCGFRLVSYSASVQLSNSISVGNTGIGIQVEGTGAHVVTASRISGNGFGVTMSGGPFQITHNVVAGNNTFGISFGDRLELENVTTTVSLNDVIGNAVGFSLQQRTAFLKISKNNIYGNGTDGSNCGITVAQTGADARNNYWGAPTGPGVDPADQVGEEPLCNGTIPNNDAGLPLTTPFSKDPFAIN
jgi:parallel beta helix pectate lyase-like protein/uncharacterized protein DUF1565